MQPLFAADSDISALGLILLVCTFAFGIVGHALLVVGWLCCLLNCLNARRSGRLAWLVVLLLLPPVSAFLYAFSGGWRQPAQGDVRAS